MGEPVLKKKACVFTIVKDEPVFLPIWFKYYSQHFDVQDIIVLNHQSVDTSLFDGIEKVVKVFNHRAFDHEWLRSTVSWWQENLLGSYEYVLFVEADEIVWHPKGLRSYIDNLNHPDVQCAGYQVVHMKDKEPAIDLSKPIMEQRNYWHEAPAYSKTLLSNHPLEWGLGFHMCYNGCGYNDSDLHLVHLHRMDYGIALQRNIDRLNMDWSEADIELGRGKQNRITGDEFEHFFYNEQHENEVGGQKMPIVEIDPVIKSQMTF